MSNSNQNFYEVPGELLVLYRELVEASKGLKASRIEKTSSFMYPAVEKFLSVLERIESIQD